MSDIEKSQCRLCLDYDTPKLNVLNKVPNEADIPSIIFELFSFWIRESDLITKDVCLDCVKLVKFFYLFTLKVKESQRVLLANYESTQIKVESDNQHSSNTCNATIKQEYIPMVINRDLHASKTEALNLRLSNSNDQINTEPTEYETNTSDALSVPHSNDDRFSNYHEDSDDSIFENDSEQNSKLSSAIFKNIPKELYDNGDYTVSKATLNMYVNNFYNIECDICEDKPKFPKFRNLFEHFRVQHALQGYLTCCNRKMMYRRRFVSHMVCHMQPNAFQCKICKSNLSGPVYLNNHIKRFHQPDSEKQYRCDQCDKSLSSAVTLNEHKLTFHSARNEESKIKCAECGKVYYSQLTLKRHMYTHTTHKRYLCTACGKSFQDSNTFKYHMDLHNPADVVPVQCQECGTSMKSIRSLRVHMKIKHSSTVLNCKLCDYTHKSSTALKRHMITKHSNERPFVCEVCNKGFKFKNNLQQHFVQHTGEQKYSCAFCPRMFASSGNCYKHQIRMHPELHKIMRSKNQNGPKKITAVDTDIN